MARPSLLPWRMLARALGAALLVVSSPAAADPSATEKETARSLMDEADRRLANGETEAALKAYRAADDIMHVPTTGIEVARALEKLGRLLEARDTYMAVARAGGQVDSKAYQKARHDAEQALVALEPRIPRLEMTLVPADVSPPPRVTIDGVGVPPEATTIPRRVDPGKHLIVVSASGYKEARVEALFKEGDTQKVLVTLTRAETPGQVPTAKDNPPAAPPSPSAPSQPSERSTSALTYAAFGVGAVGVVAGSITGVMALNKAAAAREHCIGDACYPEAQSSIDASTAYGTVSTVSFAIGAVGIGVGVYLLLTQGSAATTPASLGSRAVLVPSLTGLSGRF